MKFIDKERRILNGYMAAFGLLLLSYLMVFLVIRELEKRAVLVNRTNRILHELNILLSCIQKSQTSFRDFIILDDTTVLKPYYESRGCVNNSFAELKPLIHDQVQLTNYKLLAEKVNENSELAGIFITYYESDSIHDKKIIKERITRGATVTEEVGHIIFTMQTYENNMLTLRTREFENNIRSLKIVHFTTFIIALMLVVYSMVIFNRVNVAKRKYRMQLEEGIEKLKIANNDLINFRSMEKFAASGRIARAIAHEVRNPLTSISLANEQLAAFVKTNEESAFLLEVISRNVNRIGDLIQELLNSTRFSQLELKRISLTKITDEALELANDRIELNNIKVNRNTPDEFCVVEADPEKLKIALLNLIINAIEAMDEGGKLDVATFRQLDKCMVTIADNGKGMNHEEIGHIFEPYFTLKESGNGLGLTLTQNIILNHKGNIEVESELNKGTKFTITLNCAL